MLFLAPCLEKYFTYSNSLSQTTSKVPSFQPVLPKNQPKALLKRSLSPSKYLPTNTQKSLSSHSLLPPSKNISPMSLFSSPHLLLLSPVSFSLKISENQHLLCCSPPQPPWRPNYHHGSSHVLCHASSAARYFEADPLPLPMSSSRWSLKWREKGPKINEMRIYIQKRAPNGGLHLLEEKTTSKIEPMIWMIYNQFYFLLIYLLKWK